MKLFAFMGASGSGKSTIQHSLPLRFLTHYVTRELREGEIDGYHVIHISKEEFEKKWEHGSKIRTRTEYAGNLYGAPHYSILDIASGKIPYHATVTADSVKQFKDLLGEENVVVIYIKPPEIQVLKNRMLSRGDKLEDVDKRIAHIYSAKEFENERHADYVVVNDKLETAIAQVHTIIQIELGVDDLERFREKKEQYYEDSDYK